MDMKKKLVALGADGASVNSGDKGGVRALLEEDMPWVVYMWCMSHRLELALKSALADTFFESVNKMLLNLYLLFYKSPKKLRELKEIHDLLKDSFEFDDKGHKPLRASGTRWLAHKSAALRKCLDKFSIFMMAVQNIASDKSYPSKEATSDSGIPPR